MKRSKLRSLGNKITEQLNIPAVALGTGSRIEINAGMEIIIEGCRNVIEYEDDKIVLLLCDGMMTLTGRGLMLSRYGENCLMVKGKLQGFALTEG